MPPAAPAKLGILAGGGDLPARIVAACRRRSRPFFVLAFEGHTAPETVADPDIPHAWVRLGAVGKALKRLREAGVEELVLAGPIRKPSLGELKPDFWAVKLLATKGARVFDDAGGLLYAIVRELEEKEGFRVVPVEALIPDTSLDSGPAAAKDT